MSASFIKKDADGNSYIDAKDLKKGQLKEKIKSFGRKALNNVQNGCKAVLNFAKEHPYTTAVAGPAIVKTIRVGKKVYRKHKEDVKARTFYDYSTRRYVHSKTKLTPRQEYEFAERRKNHERVTDILDDMGQLKKR